MEESVIVLPFFCIWFNYIVNLTTYIIKDQINEPTPKPPINHVINLRLLFDIIPKNSCNNQSINIIINKLIDIYQIGSEFKNIRQIAIICQIVEPKHLAHIFMRFPLTNKHLSGIPWQPRLIFFIFTMNDCNLHMFL